MLFKRKRTGFPSKDRTHLKGVPLKKRHPLVLPLSMLSAFWLINFRQMDESCIEQNGHRYTKRQVFEGALATIKMLVKVCDLKPKDVIAFATPNCYESTLMILAANAIGLDLAMLDDKLEQENLVKELNRFGADALVVFNREQDFVTGTSVRVQSLEWIIDLGGGREGCFNTGRCKFQSYQELMRIPHEKANVWGMMLRHALNDEALVYLRTSGSSAATPKILPFSNTAIFGGLLYTSDASGVQACDSRMKRCLHAGPNSVSFGFSSFFENLIGGQTIVLLPNATLEELGQCARYHVNFMHGTPTMLGELQKSTPDDIIVVKCGSDCDCGDYNCKSNWFK